MCAKRRRRVSWSDLPSEIIHEISKHLNSRPDLYCFRLICRKWRNSSVSLPLKLLSPVLPILIPIPTDSHSHTLPFHNSTHPLILQVSSIYLIKPTQPAIDNGDSSKPWMILAEESKPGKIQLLHPLTEKRVINVPPVLDLTQFTISELAVGYSFKYSNFLHKILLCSVSGTSSLEAMVLYYDGVLGKITLIPSDNEKKLTEGYRWESLKRSWKHYSFRYLDDIVIFKDVYCGVDRLGRVYELNPEEMTVKGFLIADQLHRKHEPNYRRKRLAVDTVSMELHLVERKSTRAKHGVQFKVYKFDDESKCWVVVDSLGRERVLFVGSGHCFFGKVEDFPGCPGNCIMFAANCFTQYCGRDSPDESLFGDEDVDVGVYQMGKGDNFNLLSSAYSLFAETIWPPPSWFSTKREIIDVEEIESDSSIQVISDEETNNNNVCLPDDCEEDILTENSAASTYREEDEDYDEELQADFSSDEKASEVSYSSESNHSNEVEDEKEEAETNSQCEQPHTFEANVSEETRPSPSKPVDREQNHPGHSSALGSSMELGCKERNIRTPVTNYQNHGKATPKPAFPGLNSESSYVPRPLFVVSPVFSAEGVTDVKPTVRTPTVPPGFEKLHPSAKFQGVDIREELRPTLETIWAKYGNLIGESTVRSKKILGSALEELAELVITLQNTTGRALTDTQANNLRLNVLDFERQGLRMDWLVPIVDKAVAMQKSKSLIKSIVALDKKIAEVEEKERAFLAESAKSKKELKESRACLSSRVGLQGTIDCFDLDNVLGKGLW